MPRCFKLSVVPVLLLLMIVSSGAFALVTNGEFDVRAEGTNDWPDGWQAPAEYRGIYVNVDDDGYTDSHSLQYRPRLAGPAGAVVQAVTCEPATNYVLSAALKSDGETLPVVQVRVPGTDQVLAAVTSEGAAAWTVFTAPFSSGNHSRLEVHIFGDARIVQSGQAVAGASGIDAVGIRPAAEAAGNNAAANGFTLPGPNIALHKSYTMTPRPSYGYCTDPDDVIQLTDGEYTVGYFWTQLSTVGWRNAMPIMITIDLEKVEPIAGLLYNTAGGRAGVEFPSAIFILVSDDGNNWVHLGDLVEMSAEHGLPPEDEYAVHSYVTDSLNTRARFVQFITHADPYHFVDEIEIYRGPDELLTSAPDGRTFTDPMKFFIDLRIMQRVAKRMQDDLDEARAAINNSALPRDEKAAMLERAAQLQQKIHDLPEESPAGFDTILPINDAHAEIYALYAPVLRSRGLAPLTVWAANRWDPQQLQDAPRTMPRTPALDVRLMSREHRGEVLNLTNTTDSALQVTLNISGLPGGTNPDYIIVRDVLATDTRDNEPITAALPPARTTQRGYRISVPAGTTRQVWLAFRPMEVPAGTYQGQVSIQAGLGAGLQQVPLNMTVYPFTFPEQPKLAVGGWDYTNGNAAYYGHPGNVDKHVSFLREHYVDTPWATNAVAPSGDQYDEEGRLTNADELNFKNWNDWLVRWEGARNYCVFMAVGDNFRREPMGTDRFNRMVGDYITAWADHIRAQGLHPSQLALLLYDEPTRPEQDEIIATWARAIIAVEPDVVIWNDPCHADPETALPDMYETSTVLCPNTPRFIRSEESYREFFVDQQREGRLLWLYSCSGPAKLLDPYSYHRGQKWWAVQYDALGSCYWAFGCAGRGDSWNAYAQVGVEYGPYFVSATDVTEGKHMEAIREGVQDYEYFMMLRERIAELEARGVRSPVLEQAKRLYTEGPRRVTSGITYETLFWKENKNRGVMDQVRVEVLEMLVKLQNL